MGLTQITTGGVDDNINIDSNTLKVDGTNNRVGIGTSSPSANLHVSRGDGNPTELKLTNSEGTYKISANANVVTHDSNQHLFRNAAASTEYARIDSSGRVGIGTSSPAYKLHVSGANAEIGLTDTNVTDATWRLLAQTGNTTKLFRIYDSSNAADRFVINASGNVGIGTTSPGEKLEIQDGHISVGSSTNTTTTNTLISGYGYILSGSKYGNVSIRSSYVNTTNAAGLEFYVAAPSVSEAMRITSSGNVGIGRTSASSRLHIATSVANGSSPVGMQIGNDGSGSGTGASISLGAGNAAASTAGNIAGFFDGTGTALSFNTSSSYGVSTYSERMRIDSAGQVGIGTSSPGALLNLEATNSASLRIKNTQNNTPSVPHIELLNNNNEGLDIKIDRSGIGSRARFIADAEISFEQGSSERMRIDSSGRLLVGTTSEFGGNNEMLQIARSGGGAIALLRNDTSVSSGNELGAISWYGNDSTSTTYQECATIRAVADGTHADNDKPSRLIFSTTQNNTGSVTERMRIGQDGTSKIFSSSSTNTFTSRNGSSAGTTYACFIGQHSSTDIGTGTTSFHVGTNGNVRNTNNSYGSLSDIKLKENIVDSGSQWDDIKEIRVRKYNFKASTNHETFTQLGVIAQEVETVSPGLVTDSPDLDGEGNDLGTTTKSVNYSVLYMKAVKALQEAMDRIETLEAKVAALEAAE